MSLVQSLLFIITLRVPAEVVLEALKIGISVEGGDVMICAFMKLGGRVWDKISNQS